MTRRGGLTPRGFAFVGIGIALLAVAWSLRLFDLVWPALGAILVPLVALLVTLMFYPRLRVTREIRPTLIPAGGEMTMDLTLVNHGLAWGVGLEVSDSLPPGFGGTQYFTIPAQLRGQATHHTLVLQPRRRGQFVLDGLEYQAQDPLGLSARIARSEAASTVRVTPMVFEVPMTMLRASGREGETPIPQSTVWGPDDATAREYQPRDDVRRIHWPLTARTGELMVRREEQAWDPAAWVLLDSRAWDGSRATKVTFEWLVSLVASWGVRLAGEGFELHLTDADGETFSVVGGTSVTRTTSWLEYLVDVTTSDEESLTGGVSSIARAQSGHETLAILGRLSVADARQLVAAESGVSRCHAFIVPPTAERSAEHERGVEILTAHGWVVRTVPVGSKPDDWSRA